VTNPALDSPQQGVDAPDVLVFDARDRVREIQRCGESEIEIGAVQRHEPSDEARALLRRVGENVLHEGLDGHPRSMPCGRDGEVIAKELDHVRHVTLRA